MTRRPRQILEIDLPYCSLTYGTGACTAVLGTTGPRKCFQMYGTSVQRRFKQGGCQDPSNFTPGTKTLRFSHAVNGLPKLSGPIYPAMRGAISGSALEINIGGVDDKKGPLGRRETLRVNLKDFQDNDSDLDKYQAERVSGAAQADTVGYDPATRGTFFGRLLARWPYWEGAAVRVLDGYVGDDLGDYTARHYVIHSITGPDFAGNVSIELYDVLDLVSRKRMIPVPNNGELPVDIEEDYLGDFTLEATGLGDAEYAASGRICIGNEVMTFTRSGDTFTITARGLDGTEVDGHSRGDTVQQCWRCENATLDEVQAEVLEDYAGVPSALIPASEWGDEVSTWLPSLRLTRTIPKPRDVLDVTASLQRLGVFIWWDREDQLIGLRANRPVSITETPAVFDMNVDFVESSVRKVELPEQRYTDVLFWHGLIDPTKSPTDGENYNRVLNVADNDATGDNAHGASGRRFLNIFCPWLGEGDAISATAIAARLVYRFNRTPQKITALLDRDRNSDLVVAAPVTVTTRLIQFDDGAPMAARMQIIKAQKMQGERVEAVFQSYEFDGRFGVITENSRPDYGASSEAEIEVGSYFVDGSTEEFPDGTGPFVFF